MSCTASLAPFRLLWLARLICCSCLAAEKGVEEQKKKIWLEMRAVEQLLSNQKGTLRATPLAWQIKLSTQPNDRSQLALLWEKRAAEIFDMDANYWGYWSAYLHYHAPMGCGVLGQPAGLTSAKGARRCALVVGDFGLHLAQGILLNFPKGAYSPIRFFPYLGYALPQLQPILALKRKHSFRGLGVICDQGHHHLGSFFSCRYLDATTFEERKAQQGLGENLDLGEAVESAFGSWWNSLTDRDHYVRSVARRGMAFTRKKDLCKQNQFREIVWGGWYQHQDARSAWGAGLLLTRYDPPIRPIKFYFARPYLERHGQLNGGFWGRYIYKGAHLFGEGCLGAYPAALAALAGVVWSYDPHADLLLLGHLYGHAFYAPFGDALSKQSHNYNERSIELVWRKKEGKVGQSQLMVQLGYHPAPSYLCRQPTPFIGCQLSQSWSVTPERCWRAKLHCKGQYYTPKSATGGSGGPSKVGAYQLVWVPKISATLRYTRRCAEAPHLPKTALWQNIFTHWPAGKHVVYGQLIYHPFPHKSALGGVAHYLYELNTSAGCCQLYGLIHLLGVGQVAAADQISTRSRLMPPFLHHTGVRLGVIFTQKPKDQDEGELSVECYLGIRLKAKSAEGSRAGVQVGVRITYSAPLG